MDRRCYTKHMCCMLVLAFLLYASAETPYNFARALKAPTSPDGRPSGWIDHGTNMEDLATFFFPAFSRQWTRRWGEGVELPALPVFLVSSFLPGIPGGYISRVNWICSTLRQATGMVQYSIPLFAYHYLPVTSSDLLRLPDLENHHHHRLPAAFSS